MKINLKNSKNQLSRDEMRTVIAGHSFSGGTSQVLCNDGTEHEVESCDKMEEACSSNGGAKICSGS
ncbi:hypothetical protein [uncultured Kordia sp.]|uniref:hypothetical protein n=1 Tax=uncultured Kordia sp. TaxID=507699 RepID=UPI00262D4312|nr:hypothetical protein [uncultured Kordia sp.]